MYLRSQITPDGEAREAERHKGNIGRGRDLYGEALKPTQYKG